MKKQQLMILLGAAAAIAGIFIYSKYKGGKEKSDVDALKSKTLAGAGTTEANKAAPIETVVDNSGAVRNPPALGDGSQQNSDSNNVIATSDTAVSYVDNIQLNFM